MLTIARMTPSDFLLDDICRYRLHTSVEDGHFELQSAHKRAVKHCGEFAKYL